MANRKANGIFVFGEKIMTKFYRYERIFTWTMIAIALLWLCLVLIPQVGDRISMNEDRWLKQGWRHVEDSVSVKPSEED